MLEVQPTFRITIQVEPTLPEMQRLKQATVVCGTSSDCFPKAGLDGNFDTVFNALEDGHFIVRSALAQKQMDGATQEVIDSYAAMLVRMDDAKRALLKIANTR